MRRRFLQFTLVSLALCLCVAAGVWGYILTHQQQIGQMISARLSAYINTPVSLQQATIGFHPTPTIDFSGIVIKAEDHHFQATIPQLQVRLSWRDLFAGQLDSSHLTAISPEIIWQIPPPPTAQPAQVASQHILDKKIIPPHLKLTIREGRIQISRQEYPDQPTWTLTGVRLDLRPTLLQGLTFQCSGEMIRQGETRTPFFSRIQINQLDRGLQAAQIHIRTSFEQLELPANLQRNWPVELNGAFNMQAESVGSLTTGVQTDITVTGKNNTLQLRKPYNNLLPLGNLTASFRLAQRDNTLQLDQGRVTLNDITLYARGSWNGSENNAKKYQLTLSSTPITSQALTAWLPSAWAESLNRAVTSGTVTLKGLQLASDQWPPTLDDIQVDALELNLSQAQIGQTTLHNTRFTLSGSTAQCRLTSTPVEFTAGSSHVGLPLDLTAQRKNSASWHIKANFSALDYNLAKVLTKAAGTAGSLKVELARHDRGWSLNDGHLLLPDIDLMFSGVVRNGDDYRFSINSPGIDLSTLGREIPLLQQMALQGTVAIDQTLLKQPGQSLTSSGTLQLTDCAIAPTHVIAPIHHINGSARLSGWQLDSRDLSVQLGSSQLTVDALIEDLRHPLAQIHAQSQQVVAQDLVFNSPSAILYDLDGRINIHAKGIDFVDAKVRLEQGTTATVTGTLLFHGPDLQLLVEAPYANVDEVIALWHGSTAHGHTTPWPHHPHRPDEPETLHIHAVVSRGIISGFEFSETTGTIHYRYGRLRIEPLLFEADAGYGSGKVIVNQLTDPTTLQIEGSVVNLDADKVYSQLLKHTGLVTGELTGDFSINGPIGSNFLPNSNGIFSVTIKDGVLRKFKVLSKAFSLLNVAQLFKFKLPDMALEGMPFNQLTSDVTLKNGVLSSENLRVDSDAMNTVLAGKLDLVQNQLDLIMGIKPLGTVDTVFTRIPVAGWLLTGDEHAVLSTNFAITGPLSDPRVEMLPLSSLSNKVFGIFKRTLTLPGTLIKDPEKVLTNPDRESK